MKKSVGLISVVVALTVIFTLGSCLSIGAAEPKIDIKELAKKNVPILLEFGRGWCKPCKYMKPILDDMTKVYGSKAIITTVDMDVNAGLVREFKIRLMPTQVFITPDGKEFYRNEGTMEREQIVQIFEKMGLPKPAM
jgi:thioredoxin 1